VTLAEEVLVWAGLDVPSPDLRMPGDSQIETACQTCHDTQMLSEAQVEESGDETVYTCKNGCQPILVISVPGDEPWEGRGYRMGDWVLRNPDDLIFRLIDEDGDPHRTTILLPASPAALE
jgi:hypothetical protein